MTLYTAALQLLMDLDQLMEASQGVCGFDSGEQNRRWQRVRDDWLESQEVLRDILVGYKQEG